jgi:hypothetical protein
MTVYSIYNLVLAGLILPATYCIAGREDRWRTLSVAAKVGVLLTLIAYPWDFFAIQFNAWRYVNDPGPLVYGVPFNDLIFMWLCTYLACTALIAVDRWERRHGRHAKCEHAGEKHTGKQRDRPL